MKLTLIQMQSVPERDRNLGTACDLIDKAVASEHPDVIVLPEFFNTIYVFQFLDPKYFSESERDDGVTITRMRDKAREHGVHIVATIFEEETAGVYYDTAVIIDRHGEIIGKYRKTHPAAVKSLEKIYFRFGSYFPVFKVDDWRMGVNICYDGAFPEAAR